MESQQPLYPFRFEPIYLEKIWGGQQLHTQLGRSTGAGDWGESWELSGLPERPSVVGHGPLAGSTLTELTTRYGVALTGRDDLDTFPVLIKMLDAQRDLSIQVHPDDAMAARKHGGRGKTEMWYILAAEPGARLITGFQEGVTPEDFDRAFASGDLLSVCNEVPVKAGEVYSVPAGRIHTIGGGILLAEIQQSSDYTYRIYDWDRKDPQGNLRELHVAEAKEALDYTETGSGQCSVAFDAHGIAPLVVSPHFTTFLRRTSSTHTLGHAVTNSFTTYTVAEGSGTLRYQGEEIELEPGVVVLLPAALSDWEVSPKEEILWLETHL